MTRQAVVWVSFYRFCAFFVLFGTFRTYLCLCETRRIDQSHHTHQIGHRATEGEDELDFPDSLDFHLPPAAMLLLVAKVRLDQLADDLGNTVAGNE